MIEVVTKPTNDIKQTSNM